MIVLSDTRREEASELKSITSLKEPLTERARRAVAAAAAVQRGDFDLEQAARRYGIAGALIEAWQHSLQGLRRDPNGRREVLRAGRC